MEPLKVNQHFPVLNLSLKSCLFTISLGYATFANYKEITDPIDTFFNKMNSIKSLAEKSAFGRFKGRSNHITKKGGRPVNWEPPNQKHGVMIAAK